MHENFDSALYDMRAISDVLAQYYEAAGFSDYHDKVLSKMTDGELFGHFVETFRPSGVLQESDAAEEEESFDRLLEEVRR